MSYALGIALLVGAGLCAIAIAISHSLIADEVRAWLPYLARRLVRSTARRLPADTRDRCESDWLAELAAWEDRPLSALAKAAHLRWNARAIRESLGGASIKGDRLKRTFDLGSAMALLLVLAPLLIATAIAIKVESRGPVFFRQPRAGRGRTSFRLIKFRSMYVDAEERQAELMKMEEAGDGVMFKIREDPRVTKVGRFLRRFSLDEMPQLFNVLKGDMSLVGPRPPIFPETDAQKKHSKTPELEVRPGLTSPGQIHSLDCERETPQESQLDEEYARSRSLLLDLRLLVRTVRSILHRSR